MNVELQIVTKDAFYWDSPNALLFVLSSLKPEGLSADMDFQGVVDQLKKHDHEWTVGYFSKANRKVDQVHLLKSVFSFYELYFIKSDDDLFVSDTFVNCVAKISPSQRTPTDDAIVDHFLFRAVNERNTHCHLVKRVSHGEWIQFSAKNKAGTSLRLQRHEQKERPGSKKEYLSRVDRGLQTVLSAWQDDSLMFSGGIDSSLLACYMRKAPLVFNKISSPEFNLDASYAVSAAKLLGRQLETFAFPEEKFMSRLEQVVDRIGMPPQHAQTILHSEGFAESTASGFVVGEYADTMFGFVSPRRVRYGSLLAKPYLSFAYTALGLLPVKKFRNVLQVAAQFKKNVRDSESYANSFSRPLDLSIGLELFSPEIIHARCASRVEYALDVVGQSSSQSVKDFQMDIGHFTAYYSNETPSIWRQLAQNHGKSCHFPFPSPRISAVCKSIPVVHRYSSGKEDKYLLKTLLEAFVPDFPSNRPKRGAAMPICRMASEGGLKQVFERYTLPAFISQKTLHDVILQNYAATWHLISYMVWADRVKSIVHRQEPIFWKNFVFAE